MVLNVRRDHNAYYGREEGERGMEVEEEGGTFRLHCHHRNDSCIEMGSDVSHFH